MHRFNGVFIKKEEIIPLAEKMRNEGKRLLIINSYLDKEGSNVIVYNFDIGGEVKSYLCKGHNVLPSISHIYGGSAEWCEEEICEMLPIEFEGLSQRGRLFLPEDFDGRGQILVLPLSELKKHKVKEEKK